MLHTIVLSLLAGLAGLWIATEFVPGVDFTGELKNFLIAGLILGIILAVARPLLNLFSLIVKLAVLLALVFSAVWALDIFFPELTIPNLTSLALSGFAVAAVLIVLSLFSKGKI